VSCLVFTALPSLAAGTDSGYSAPSEALTVSVPEENKTYHFRDPARLSQVLEYIYPTLNYKPYTLAASLVRLSKNAIIEQKKDAVIQQLIALNTDSALYMIAQLSNTELAFRESVSFNLDDVRLHPKKNPLLTGKFQLILPARPNHFWVYGATEENIPLAVFMQDGFSLRDYFADIPSSNPEGKYRPWIIQPDQTLYRTKDMYWKGTPYFLSPGAVVFIGLKNLPEKFKNLNQEIAHLLTYRVEK
jgi:hypothetical protein